jgi:hypothetical protein
VMASQRRGLLELASSMSWGAVDFSGGVACDGVTARMAARKSVAAVTLAIQIGFRMSVPILRDVVG